ncbi:MAG: hypothetical protein Q9160_004981 [Pyrenula sp. 1 TL-2023]
MPVTDAVCRSQATPLTAFIRVPLTWYQSHTISFYPDERHADIRRTFSPPETPHVKRNFCGFCGTHLSYWTEEPFTESDYLNVTIGSLRSEDLRALEDLDLLPDDISTEIITTPQTAPSSAHEHSATLSSTVSGQNANVPWFEEMIEGSRLGRTEKTKRGMAVSGDGRTRVEWEVSEFEDEGPGTPRGKRKLEDDSQDDNEDKDIQMRT